MKLLSVPAMAKVSGISYWTLLRLIHENKLRAVQLPGRRSYLIDPADLNRLIESSKTEVKTGTKTGTKNPELAPKTATSRINGKRRRKSSKATSVPYYMKYGRPVNG